MTAFAHIAGPAFSRPVQIAARLYIVTTPSATTPCANGSRNKNLNSCSTKAKGLVMALGFFLWTAYWYVLGICIWYWYLVVLSGEPHPIGPIGVLTSPMLCVLDTYSDWVRNLQCIRFCAL